MQHKKPEVLNITYSSLLTIYRVYYLCVLIINLIDLNVTNTSVRIRKFGLIRKAKEYANRKIYPKNHVRIVTAASLFDGHDAAINVMRRIMQSTGAEVIHLGHDRSVQEIVDCCHSGRCSGIALTSYQGGHIEYFKYMYDLFEGS